MAYLLVNAKQTPTTPLVAGRFSSTNQVVRRGWHLDLPRVVRRLHRGHVLHLAHGEALVAGVGRPALCLPPEILLHPHLHRSHQRAGHLHRIVAG